MTDDTAASGAGTVRDEEIVLFRCTKCGKLSVSIGWLHGHIERHQGLGPWNTFPAPRKIGNFNALMDYTEVLRVTEVKKTTLDDVEVKS